MSVVKTRYSAADLVAHILWETTWYGFDEKDVQDKLATIVGRAEEIQNYTAEERAANLIPWDEVKQRLGIDDED